MNLRLPRLVAAGADGQSRASGPLQFLLVVSLSLLLLLAAQEAVAKRVALVIGNGDYQHESDLRNPVNDARLVARTLRGLGFDVEERLNLNRRDMTLALARFADQSSGAATAVVYFAGHGMQPSTGGRNFLLPVDANIDSDAALLSDAVAADEMEQQLKRVSNPARVRLVILDACRNNPRAGLTRGTVRGLSRMAPSDDYTLIAFSTDEHNVAQDGAGIHSPYAEALSRHLSRARELPLRRIFELTAADVRAATRQAQRPRTYGDLDSQIGLDGVVVDQTSQSAASSPGGVREDLEAEAWALCRSGRTAVPCQDYLSAWPQGRFAVLARTRMRDLGTVVADLRVEPQTAPQATPSAPTPPAQSMTDVSRPEALPAVGATVRAGQVLKDCDVCPELVAIAPGRFQMGSPVSELQRKSDEDQRWVMISQRFAIGATEVTQAQWRAVMMNNPSWSSGCDDCPVHGVSWNDVQEYIRRLNVRTGNRFGYRLPSEAEWEYAARAGTGTPFWTGQTITTAQANFAGGYTYNGSAKGESRRRVTPVKMFPANPWGLHDVHGNVWEWVQDCYGPYRQAPGDGTAREAAGCSSRVLRGGSWVVVPAAARSALRRWVAPDERSGDIGFRLARNLPREGS